MAVLKQSRLALMHHERSLGVLSTYYDSFLDACKDDLNINLAISFVFEQVKQLNQALRQRDIDVQDVVSQDDSLRNMMAILGITCPSPHLSTEEITCVEAWQRAKGDKDYERADQLRQQLISMDVLT